MKCIYCGKTEEKEFTEQEHIIPRTIGGVNMLPLGMVCDECNTEFSVYEKRFVYDSPVSMFKQFDGPAGRHGRYRSNLHLMKNTADNTTAIGYIEQGGIPHLVPQVIVKKDKTIAFTGESCFGNGSMELIERIKNIPKSEIIRKKLKDIDEDRIYLVDYKKKFFSFKNEKMSDDIESSLIELVQQAKIDMDENSIEIRSSKVCSHQSMSFNMDDFGRIICKMVFNLTAQYYPNKILTNDFDLLRKYIRYNERPKGKRFYYLDDNAEKMFVGIKEKFKILANVHLILLCSNPLYKHILGFVSLYDNMGITILSGHEDGIINFNPLRLYISEYKNRKEYEYLEENIKQIKKERKGMA